jgi:hypothetical protein
MVVTRSQVRRGVRHQPYSLAQKLKQKYSHVTTADNTISTAPTEVTTHTERFDFYSPPTARGSPHSPNKHATISVDIHSFHDLTWHYTFEFTCSCQSHRTVGLHVKAGVHNSLLPSHKHFPRYPIIVEIDQMTPGAREHLAEDCWFVYSCLHFTLNYLSGVYKHIISPKKGVPFGKFVLIQVLVHPNSPILQWPFWSGMGFELHRVSSGTDVLALQGDNLTAVCDIQPLRRRN